MNPRSVSCFKHSMEILYGTGPLYDTSRISERHKEKFRFRLHLNHHLTNAKFSCHSTSRIKKPCDSCKRYLDHLDGKNQNVRPKNLILQDCCHYPEDLVESFSTS